MAPYKRREDSHKRISRREESPPRERRSRDDVMNEEPLAEARIQKGRTSHQGAIQNEDIKLMLVNGYPFPTPTITPTPNIVKVKVLTV